MHPIFSTRSSSLSVGLLAMLLVGACDQAPVGPHDDELLDAEAEEADEVDETLLDPGTVPPGPFLDDEPVLERPDFDLTAEPDVQAYAWKGWVSEEDPPSTCATGQLVSGMDCAGSWCDEMRVQCHNFGGTLGDSTWVPYFSNEAPYNFALCPDNKYMTGFKCKDSYCDKLSIECTTTNLDKDDCAWTDLGYSEEDPAYLAPAGKAIAGIWCTGDRCDTHFYWVCEI